MSELSNHLKVSYQQLQKYEQASNRVSASMLWEIAQSLNVPISSFYPNQDRLQPADSTEVSIIQNFRAIESPQQKQLVFDLIELLASRSGR